MHGVAKPWQDEREQGAGLIGLCTSLLLYPLLSAGESARPGGVRNTPQHGDNATLLPSAPTPAQAIKQPPQLDTCAVEGI
ncbi:uncharacterized [Tachysurus ichikawai]